MKSLIRSNCSQISGKIFDRLLFLRTGLNDQDPLFIETLCPSESRVECDGLLKKRNNKSLIRSHLKGCWIQRRLLVLSRSLELDGIEFYSSSDDADDPTFDEWNIHGIDKISKSRKA